jgi:hypothetical protein
MAYDHKLPVSEPESDIIVALFIPLHHSYTSLVLGALRVLEDEAYYERDPDGGNAGAKAAADAFRRRTITPLIETLTEE